MLLSLQCMDPMQKPWGYYTHVQDQRQRMIQGQDLSSLD